MSKADKMFKELGFKKNKPFDNETLYFYAHCEEDEPAEYICFNRDKTVSTFCSDKDYMVCLNKEWLQAINEKCKELGWLDKEN